MIFKRPDMLTHLEIWQPKYSTKHKDGEWRVLLACYKVDNASPWIIVDFSKAQHLKGQRYCIKRTAAQSYPRETNGKIQVYSVPFNKLEGWTTVKEEHEIINSFGW